MTGKKSFIKNIQFWVVIFLVILGVTIVAIDTIISYRDLNSRTKQIRMDYIATQKQIIKKEVLRVVDLIYYKKAQSKPYSRFNGTGLSDDDIETQIKEELLSDIGRIRFGPDGYIFVVTYDGTTLMNDTQKHLIGINIWDLTDPNGVKVIQEERKAVENPDGDFIYYSWNKPLTKQIGPHGL